MVKKTLVMSGHYISQITKSLDRSEGGYSARGHGDYDSSNDNSTESKDDPNVDEKGQEGTTSEIDYTTDVTNNIKPDAEPHHSQRRLDNTLCPEGLLKNTMPPEKAIEWLNSFERYLVWKSSLIESKGAQCVRALLESFITIDLFLDFPKTSQSQKKQSFKAHPGY